MVSMESTNTAKDFFNSISSSYKHKYSEKDIFHYYFFTERLEKTTYNLNLDQKKILDVGAGTGDLYDYICHKATVAAYTATDVANGMLSNSNIPKERQMLGEVTSLKLPFTDYDYVFMLGVTTYLTIDEMKNHLVYFKQVINKKEGTLIITFTNSKGFDNFFRTLFKPLLTLIPNKKNVLSQKILIQKYSLSQAKSMFEELGYTVESVSWLNHTVFPLNLIFKQASVFLAKKMDGIEAGWFQSLFSSDFVIKAKLKSI